MANKGTYAAYQKSTTPTTNFGAISKDILGGVEKKRQRLLAEELARGKAKQEASKYAHGIRQKAADNAMKLAQLGKDMLNVDTSGIMNPLATEMLKTAQLNYYNVQKQSLNASQDKQHELTMKTVMLNGISSNFNALAKGVDDFMADYNSTVDGHPKYSANGSAPTMIAMIEAIKGASTQGLKKNKDGSYNWGDRVKITGMGTGDMQFEIKDDKGGILGKNSMQSIMSTVKAGLKPYNDLGAFMTGITKSIKPTKKNKYKNTDTGLLQFDEYIDKNSTMEQIKQMIKNKTDNNQSFSDDVLIHYDASGENIDDAIENMAKGIYGTLDQTNNQRLQKDPGYAAKIKEEGIERTSSQVYEFLSATPGSVGKMLGKPMEVEGTFLSGTPKLNKFATKDGKILMRFEGGGYLSEFKQFDPNNTDDLNQLITMTGLTINKQSGTGKVDINDLRNKLINSGIKQKSNKYEVTQKYIDYNDIIQYDVQEVKSLLDLANSGKTINSHKLKNALKKTITNFEADGYTVNYDTDGMIYGNNHFKITDPNGKTILNIGEGQKLNTLDFLKEIKTKLPSILDTHPEITEEVTSNDDDNTMIADTKDRIPEDGISEDFLADMADVSTRERPNPVTDEELRTAKVKSGFGDYLAHIKKQEGFSAEAYEDGTDEDGNQKYSIGFGVQSVGGKAVKAGDTISRDAANIEFEKQMAHYASPLDKLNIGLNSKAKIAIVDFSYNTGASRAVRLVDMINKGDSIDDISKFISQFTKTKTKTGLKEVPALKKRRKAEVDAIKESLKGAERKDATSKDTTSKDTISKNSKKKLKKINW